jgi:carboxymethylenebutenolidase
MKMGTRILFNRVDGKKTEGYFAKAGKDHAPGVVVIQEWWGLQDQICGICDRLALAGYDALAPDLYAGTVVPYHDKDAAFKEMSSLNFLDATDQIVRGAAQYLGEAGGKIGITGFCMGGAVATLSAARAPEICAAVSFYGMPPAKFFNAADIKVPFQGHYSNHDDHPTPEEAAALTATLKAAGVDVATFMYDAGHAFMNEQRDAHDRAAAELGWQRMLSFWQKHLH